MSGPFGETALELRRHNLAPLPLGGDDGKRPLISFGKWEQPQSLSHVERLVARFSNRNVGIVCGPSKITVLDCDNSNEADDLQRLFGPTPVGVETPSGGIHFYYRTAGESCHNLRSEGFEADVKGIGGQVATAPSIRPSGEFAGKSYHFIKGSWDDLPNLPTMSPKGRLLLAGKAHTQRSESIPPSHVINGQRNVWMFRRLMRDARACDEFADLLDVAHGLRVRPVSSLAIT